MAEAHQPPPTSATLPGQVSSPVNNVDALCYVESIADLGIKTAMSNLRHRYNEVVEESSGLEYSIRDLNVTAGNFTKLAALVRFSFIFIYHCTMLTCFKKMAFFAIMQSTLLYSIQTVDPTNISTALLDTFFALAIIGMCLDLFSVLCAIQYMHRTQKLVNYAHSLLEAKRRASELISHVAKKGNHLSSSYKVALDTLNASCKSISNRMRMLQALIDNHTNGPYRIVTVTGNYFVIVLCFVSTLMAVCIIYLREV
jgi:hypothetical protein